MERLGMGTIPPGRAAEQDREHVEIATLDWVHRFNTDRSHESLDYLTPVQVEQIHYTHRTSLAKAG